MSGESRVGAEECFKLGASGETFESFPVKEVLLGKLPVGRALPVRARRLVGPWCFLDRVGPLTFGDEKPMDVAPHPHIGLQTVTWLLEGEIAHDDSLGCESVARPGSVHVMTAGRGIAHSEQTPPDNTRILDGVQLWVALPDAHRNTEPGFEAVREVPAAEQTGGVIRVFSGALGPLISPARHYSELVGAELQVHAGEAMEVGVTPDFEHALLPLAGDVTLAGRPLAAGELHYLGVRRSSLPLESDGGGRVLLIGGLPFPETILMWWNFVARTPDEIAGARADWEAGRRFGEVRAYAGARLGAPDLVRLARPNPMS